MRIAVVYDCLYPVSVGGGELQYRAFAERFATVGHDVRYLTRRQWQASPPEIPGVHITAIAGPTEVYDAVGNRRLTPAAGFATALSRHLVSHRTDYDAVLVSALPVLNVLAARAALAGSRVRICADFLEVWRPAQWVEYSGPVVGRVGRALQHAAVRMSPLASCHSQMNGRRLRQEGLPTPPIVSPGLIQPGMHADPQLAITDPPTVVFAGRMIPDKRVETLPAAIEWVRKRRGDVRGRLFGDGPQRARVRAEIDRRNLASVVELPGFVDDATLRGAMSSAACLVNPSQREGYGLVVVEANSVGTPAVLVEATDNASVELVTGGQNGIVAVSTEPEALGAAILEVIDAGAPLRESTYRWFCDAVRTRTIDNAADGILAALEATRR